MEEKRDLIVIGAGPGGYPAAFLAADKGVKVTMIDPEPNPGGVCLYRGCIPTKTILHATKVLREAKELDKWGVSFSNPVIKPEMIKQKKDMVVKQITGGVGRLCAQRKIEYLQGTSVFKNPETIIVTLTSGGTKELRFNNAIIATGSSPAWIPGIPTDSPNIISSREALDIDSVPESMLVVGGGYIGLELGSFYASLGSGVSVVELMDSILPGADSDLVRIFSQSARKLFKEIITGTKVVSIEDKGENVQVVFENEKEEFTKDYSKVLITIGRKPNSTDLGLENTEVKLDKRGFILVNKYLQTEHDTIYAIGDVIGGAMLAHKATHEGKAAVENIIGEKKEFNPSCIPAVLFTDPEVAWVGLTEKEASEKGLDYAASRFQWGASGRAVTIGRTDGVTKLIIDKKSDKIIGMGVVGAGAGELISEGALAIQMGATAHDIAGTIHPHPTLSETVMESAELYFGLCTHMYSNKR